MHNREGLTLKRLWKACCDYDLWPLYIMYVHHVPVAFFPLTTTPNLEALRSVFLLVHRRRTSLSRSAISGMPPPVLSPFTHQAELILTSNS